MGEVRFMISEAAKKVDVESHVLRYWEEELGLKIGRTEMGHRYYTNDDIQLFRCIKKLKDEGMLLRELKPLIPELQATRLKLKKQEPDDIKKDTADDAPQTPAPAQAQTGEVVIPLDKMEQVRALFEDIFQEVLKENNNVLKKDISSAVTSDVMHEMDFLLQAKERQQEEHFRRLDNLIRQQQAARRENARVNPLDRLKKILT